MTVGPPRTRNSSQNTRRALTQVGGNIESWCDTVGLGTALEAALRVQGDDPKAMRHVHGFHSYPARMHPDTASSLVRGLSREGETVLDPFSGSGTVLVEARLQGRVAYGVDANPLAIALAELKLRGLQEGMGDLLLGATEATFEFADERRQRKAGPTRPYTRELRELFAPHVLLELDGLSKGIEQCAPPQLRIVLKLVLSSLLTKVSLRQSDTSGRTVEKRLASGFTLRFFKKKAEELVSRLHQYTALLPNSGLKMGVKLGDARQLPMNDGRTNAIITSPPYPGVYDYVEHHRLRLDWLGLDAEHLQVHEIGAHRHYAYADPDEAKHRWAEQFGPCLDEMRRVLAPEGKVALLMADSVVARQAFYVDRALCDLVGSHGLSVVAGVSQRREHFHAPTQSAFRAAPRREHLIVLMAAPATSLHQKGAGGARIAMQPSTKHGSPRRRRVL